MTDIAIIEMEDLDFIRNQCIWLAGYVLRTIEIDVKLERTHESLMAWKWPDLTQRIIIHQRYRTFSMETKATIDDANQRNIHFHI